MIEQMRKLGRQLIAFAKGNSGAIIIGISLIIGLNYSRFESYFIEIKEAVGLAYYRLSGQAEEDRKAAEIYRQRQAEAAQARREQYERERQTRLAQQRELEAQERAKQQAAQARQELVRNELKKTWTTFLMAEKAKVRQIELVRNSERGDYHCLRINNDVRQLTMKYFGGTNYAEARTKAQQEVEVGTYQIRDAVADDFVQWLRDHKVLDRSDWKYVDLKDLEITEFWWDSCWSPKQVWRANR